jgi:hypothetical protein
METDFSGAPVFMWRWFNTAEGVAAAAVAGPFMNVLLTPRWRTAAGHRMSLDGVILSDIEQELCIEHRTELDLRRIIVYIGVDGDLSGIADVALDALFEQPFTAFNLASLRLQ